MKTKEYLKWLYTRWYLYLIIILIFGYNFNEYEYILTDPYGLAGYIIGQLILVGLIITIFVWIKKLILKISKL